MKRLIVEPGSKLKSGARRGVEPGSEPSESFGYNSVKPASLLGERRGSKEFLQVEFTKYSEAKVSEMAGRMNLHLGAKVRRRNGDSKGMKSGSLNVFIVYADQEARHFAIYAATSADQAVALYRRENPSRVEWEGEVKAVLEATSDGVPRRLRVQ